MTNGYMPRSDHAAAMWMQIFANGIVEHADEFDVSPVEAARVQTAVSAFVDLFTVADQTAIRTSVIVEQKDLARRAAELVIRPIYTRIKSDPTIESPTLLSIGVRPINAKRSRINAPDTAPSLMVRDVTMVSHVLVYNEPGMRSLRAKPKGVVGFQLFRSLREDANGPQMLPTYFATYTRNPVVIFLYANEDLKTATYVGRWINRRGETGPWSNRVSQRISCGSPGISSASPLISKQNQTGDLQTRTAA